MSGYVAVFAIASGGMAEIFLGTTQAEHVRPLVAIKRPHKHLLRDQAFRAAFLHEARIAARLHHANVVGVRDVVEEGESVDLVMDYVEGISLAEVLERAKEIAPAIAIRIVLDVCAGLHAAHELVDDEGQPLGLVHRDVSPQNILVGLDGVARVTDFGVAKSLESAKRPTSEGALKGKLGYLAPEYVDGRAIDRRADVFALGVVLWEALAKKRLFQGRNDGEILARIQQSPIPRLREVAPDLADRLDFPLARALDKVPEARYPTARAFATALEEESRPELVASYEEVGALVRSVAGEELATRRKRLREEYKAPEVKRSRVLPVAITVAILGVVAAVLAVRSRPVEIVKEPISAPSPSLPATVSVPPSASTSTTASIEAPAASTTNKPLKPWKPSPTKPSIDPNKPPKNPY